MIWRTPLPVVFFLALLLLARPLCGGQALLTEKFDHELHDSKVFKPQAIPCAKCHNFKIDTASGRAVLEEASRKTTLKLTLKQICHECHQGSEVKYKAAPKTCFSCHSSNASLGAIKPQNHANVLWKHSHAMEARIAGESCMNCHTTSQCVKCHTRRQDIEPANHTRNFRFTHSLEVRLQPQRCDACHTKSFCVSCHLGKK